MKEKILKYLHDKLHEVEDEIVFDEEEFCHWSDKVELIKDIINDVEDIK